MYLVNSQTKIFWNMQASIQKLTIIWRLTLFYRILSDWIAAG